jgi:hypothetical protein
MKVINLNETLLLERPVSGKVLSDIELSDEIKKSIEAGDWKTAYEKSDIGVEDGDMYAIFIEYQPTSKHLEVAKKLNGEIAGIERAKNNLIFGYLQENPNHKKAEQAGLINIGGLGDELVSVVKKDASGNVESILKEGYFNIIETTKGATPYSKKDSDILIKTLKGVGSGVKLARADKVTRESIGVVSSQQDLVINEYLKATFGNELGKISEFKEYVIKDIVEVGFSNNPIIEFLKEYLKTHDMKPNGFISLNNLYANGYIDDSDLMSNTEFKDLLNSNLLEQTRYSEAEYIVDTYRSLLYTYETFNPQLINQLSQQQGLRIELDNKGVVKKEFRKNLADLVVFKEGTNKKEVKSLNDIKSVMTRLNTRSDQQRTPPAGQREGEGITVRGAPSSLAPDDEAKFNQIFNQNNLTEKDVPALMAYIKSRNLVK